MHRYSRQQQYTNMLITVYRHNAWYNNITAPGYLLTLYSISYKATLQAALLFFSC